MGKNDMQRLEARLSPQEPRGLGAQAADRARVIRELCSRPVELTDYDGRVVGKSKLSGLSLEAVAQEIGEAPGQLASGGLMLEDPGDIDELTGPDMPTLAEVSREWRGLPPTSPD